MNNKKNTTKPIKTVNLKVEGLNEKGYGVAFLEGREYWVSNALHGEEVLAEVVGRKKKIRIAKTIEILKKNEHRISPIDGGLYSNSPWQILKFEEENRLKKKFIVDWFNEDEVKFDLKKFEIESDSHRQGYRGKAEFSLYIDEEKISLALHRKDSKRGRIPVVGSSLLPSKVNKVLYKYLEFVNNFKANFRDFKGVVVRYSFAEDKVVLNFTLQVEDFEEFDAESIYNFFDKDDVKGVVLTYSDRRSPSFRVDSVLSTAGDIDLVETINNKKFIYPFDGFFQVNPIMFEKVIKDLRGFLESSKTQKRLVDIYAGVGTIGISLSDLYKEVTSIEVFDRSKEYCLKNVEINKLKNYEIIQSSAKDALNDFKFSKSDTIVVDPPRSGLEEEIVQKIVDSKVKKLIYLSCNPKTQSRDLKIFQDAGFEVKFMKAYNFYPMTPHVENLVIIERN